jgi:hypothetical protein
MQNLQTVHAFMCIYVKFHGLYGETLYRDACLAAKDGKGPVPEKRRNITKLDDRTIPRDRWVWVRLGPPMVVPPEGEWHVRFEVFQHSDNRKSGMYISHVDIVPEYETSEEARAATEICLSPPRVRLPCYLPAANKLG